MTLNLLLFHYPAPSPIAVSICGAAQRSRKHDHLKIPDQSFLTIGRVGRATIKSKQWFVLCTVHGLYADSYKQWPQNPFFDSKSSLPLCLGFLLSPIMG